MDRETAARRFAEVMGWSFGIGPLNIPGFWFQGSDGTPFHGPLPDADAPLHEHLAFVGRVAEACGPIVHGEFGIVSRESGGNVEWCVWKDYCAQGVAPDLSHAALLAGIAAKEGAK